MFGYELKKTEKATNPFAALTVSQLKTLSPAQLKAFTDIATKSNKKTVTWQEDEAEAARARVKAALAKVKAAEVDEDEDEDEDEEEMPRSGRRSTRSDSSSSMTAYQLLRPYLVVVAGIVQFLVGVQLLVLAVYLVSDVTYGKYQVPAHLACLGLVLVLSDLTRSL